jgi:hypothetical protein
LTQTLVIQGPDFFPFSFGQNYSVHRIEP